MVERLHTPPSQKKCGFGINKNYKRKTFTTITVEIYLTLLLNCIRPEVYIRRKNQNGFRRNHSTSSQILTIRRIIERVIAKNLLAILLFVDFSKNLTPYTGNMEQIQLAYKLLKETVSAIMMLF